MNCAEPPLILRQYGAGGAQSRGGLGDVNDTASELEMRAERITRPSQNRIPKLCLAGAQPGLQFGSIQHEIRGKIFSDLGRDFLTRRGNTVDYRISKPRQRHV